MTDDVVMATDDELADAIAGAVLGSPPKDPGQLDHLALVGRCSTAEGSVRSLLQQSVDSARAAGHTWSEIGDILSMSRQAAQQRFGGTPTTGHADDERWLGPVTAFDEMTELELAGRWGWHTVEAGLLRHRMVRTPTQWEHRRVLWSGSRRSATDEGWQVACRAFPWIYLARDTGLPALPEP